MGTKKEQTKGLESIQAQFEKLVEKTEAERGQVKSIESIEGDILSALLEMGKLLLKERITNEEQHLESVGYDVVGEKNQEASRAVQSFVC
jgi:CRISPR/Cas system-associated protein endoribonuclease Cas2